MMYAKLINGVLYPAMPIFVPGEKFVYNPTKEQLLTSGYLPVQYLKAPETQNGEKPSFKWVQTDDAIVQEWNVPKKQPTTYEVARMMVAQTADDNTALRMKQFYPTFESIVGQTVKQGFKFTHGGKLWSVVQPQLTIEAHRQPGAGLESLYTEICESHAGTLEDPIPYDGNMALENGKHYSQFSTIYLCNRDTIIPVHNKLAELVGLYVTEV